jgi:hypothetical protein
VTQELQTPQLYAYRTRSDLSNEINQISKRLAEGVTLTEHILLNQRLRDLIPAHKAAPIGG